MRCADIILRRHYYFAIIAFMSLCRFHYFLLSLYAFRYDAAFRRWRCCLSFSLLLLNIAFVISPDISFSLIFSPFYFIYFPSSLMIDYFSADIFFSPLLDITPIISLPDAFADYYAFHIFRRHFRCCFAYFLPRALMPITPSPPFSAFLPPFFIIAFDAWYLLRHFFYLPWHYYLRQPRRYFADILRHAADIILIITSFLWFWVSFSMPLFSPHCCLSFLHITSLPFFFADIFTYFFIFLIIIFADYFSSSSLSSWLLIIFMSHCVFIFAILFSCRHYYWYFEPLFSPLSCHFLLISLPVSSFRYLFSDALTPLFLLSIIFFSLYFDAFHFSPMRHFADWCAYRRFSRCCCRHYRFSSFIFFAFIDFLMLSDGHWLFRLSLSFFSPLLRFIFFAIFFAATLRCFRCRFDATPCRCCCFSFRLRFFHDADAYGAWCAWLLYIFISSRADASVFLAVISFRLFFRLFSLFSLLFLRLFLAVLSFLYFRHFHIIIFDAAVSISLWCLRLLLCLCFIFLHYLPFIDIFYWCRFFSLFSSFSTRFFSPLMLYADAISFRRWCRHWWWCWYFFFSWLLFRWCADAPLTFSIIFHYFSHYLFSPHAAAIIICHYFRHLRHYVFFAWCHFLLLHFADIISFFAAAITLSLSFSLRRCRFFSFSLRHWCFRYWYHFRRHFSLRWYAATLCRRCWCWCHYAFFRWCAIIFWCRHVCLSHFAITFFIFHCWWRCRWCWAPAPCFSLPLIISSTFSYHAIATHCWLMLLRLPALFSRRCWHFRCLPDYADYFLRSPPIMPHFHFLYFRHLFFDFRCCAMPFIFHYYADACVIVAYYIAELCCWCSFRQRWCRLIFRCRHFRCHDIFDAIITPMPLMLPLSIIISPCRCCRW